MGTIWQNKLLAASAAALTLFTAGCGGGNAPSSGSQPPAQKQEQPKKEQKAEAPDALKNFITSAKPIIGALASQKGVLASLAESGNVSPEELVGVSEGILKQLAPAEADFKKLEAPDSAKELKDLLGQEFASFNEVAELGKKAFSEGSVLDKAKFLMSLKDILGKQDGLFEKISAIAKGAGIEKLISAAVLSGQFGDAQALLGKLGIVGNVLASSGKMDGGSVSLIADTAKKFLVNDAANGQAATVDFAPELINMATQGDGKYVSKFLLNIINDNQDKDQNAGTWNGSTHSIPIQAEYEVRGGSVIPGMLKTLNGTNTPSEYPEYLHEQSTVDTVNLLLKGMGALASSAKANGVI